MRISYLILLNLLSLFCQGQGCSDAGFCTMGAMRPNQFFSNKLDIRIKSVEVSQYTGITHFKDVIQAYQADVNIGITKKLVFQVKVPYMIVSGTLGSNHSLGDISLSLTQNIISKEKFQFNITAGAKLPSNNSNKTEETGKSLPMYYQTSLGTYDVVLGASIISNKWLFATGFQHPFNKNGNQFVWGLWNKDPDLPVASKYPISKNLKRGTDIMFRVERNFRFSRFNFFAGLLPIYRLNRDEAFIPAEGKIVKINGSNGLALSFIGGIGFQLSPKSSLKLLTGIRIVRRKVNPDGLSREFVGVLSYQYKF